MSLSGQSFATLLLAYALFIWKCKILVYSQGLAGRSMNTESLPTTLVITAHYCLLHLFLLLCALITTGVSSFWLKRHNKNYSLVAAHTLNSEQKHEQDDLSLPFAVLSPLCSAEWDSVFCGKVWNSGIQDRRWNLFCHQIHDNGVLSYHITCFPTTSFFFKKWSRCVLK